MSQTVIGIFDSASEAQQAVEQLVNNGILRGNIDILSQATNESKRSAGDVIGNDTHSNFFTSLFDNKEEANTYSAIAKRGSVVTVHAKSSQEAQNAAQILDQYGAVDVNDRATQYGNAEATGSKSVNAIPVIEEELKVGKRIVETGGVRLRSRIIERPVEERLRLREEHVHVERHEVNRPASESDFATFKEGVIELTEYAEVPVISKQAQVVEEISLAKDVEEYTETIRDTVRTTNVEVENLSANTTTQQNLTTSAINMDEEAALLEKSHAGWQGVLQRMKEVEDDYKVAENDADVRGWDVTDSNGEIIGEVNELIVDTSAMKVRYLDVEINSELPDTKDRHILIPIGSVSLDCESENVMVANLTSGSLANYPAYNGESISRDYENKVMSTFSPAYQTGSVTNDRFYDGEHFDSSRFSGSKKL